MEGQYLDEKTLLTKVPLIEIKPDDIIGTDSYNETALLKKFLAFDKDTQALLMKCCIQIAIVGSGNKTFGFVKHTINGKDTIVSIKDALEKNKILFNKNINEKYDEDTLSIRRIIRLLRYVVQKYITLNNRPSYLWKKYNNANEKMIGICFPGGEHIVKTKEEMDYLYNTYKKMDEIHGTKFVDRLNRTLQARGLLTTMTIYKN